MNVLLDEHADEILAAIHFHLTYEDVVSPKALSRTLAEMGVDLNEDRVGWWLRRSRAFKKRRRHGGSVWIPIQRRLNRLYQECGV